MLQTEQNRHEGHQKVDFSFGKGCYYLKGSIRNEGSVKYDKDKGDYNGFIRHFTECVKQLP